MPEMMLTITRETTMGMFYRIVSTENSREMLGIRGSHIP